LHGEGNEVPQGEHLKMGKRPVLLTHWPQLLLETKVRIAKAQTPNAILFLLPRPCLVT
jgi:hypothetical protein